MEPRRVAALRRWGAAVLVIVGLFSGLAALLPPVGWWLWAGAALVATAAAGAWAFASTRTPHLPVEEMFEGAAEEEAAFIDVPPSRAMLAASAEYAKQVYGADALTYDDLKAWWDRNPWVYLMLRSQDGRYLGHADVLPLTASGLRLLEEGAITEGELDVRDILPPESMGEAEALYLAGITVKDVGTEEGKRRAAQLIGAVANYASCLYGDRPRRLVAVAATGDGARLLRSLGARVVCPAAARKDRHDFYEVEVGPRVYEGIRERAGRRAHPARMRIEEPPRSASTP